MGHRDMAENAQDKCEMSRATCPEILKLLLLLNSALLGFAAHPREGYCCFETLKGVSICDAYMSLLIKCSSSR